jgi:hypothetical protein
MPEFYPDAALGVPEVCIYAFSFFLPPFSLLGTYKEGARKEGVSEEACSTGELCAASLVHKHVP